MTKRKKQSSAKLAKWNKIRDRVMAMKLPEWHKQGLLDQAYLKMFMGITKRKSG
jgi:hypothetical protein